MNLCQPELSLDAESLNARLSKLESQVRSGQIFPTQPVLVPQAEECPPLPGDEDAPPEAEPLPQPPTNEAPVGFWSDLTADIRRELTPPVSGFFAPTPNAPVQGVLTGNQLQLRCNSSFTLDVINKSEILSLVSHKAASRLGYPVRVAAVDITAQPDNSSGMEQLLRFGRAHSDIIKIKE